MSSSSPSSISDSQLKLALAANAERVEARLDALLGTAASEGERLRPVRLMEAMRHGVLNGGKRLRPFLVLETARLFGEPSDFALDVACALECIHCYSLIHDDLPAMDDDDLRRGKPTVHKAFDEATAILAGDALLTLAFDILATPRAGADTGVQAELVLLLARAAGLGGMIGGQMLDMAAAAEVPEEEGVRDLQAMKTGALLRFACEAGAVIGRAGGEERATLVGYGETVGLAFQLADDLLDVTSDAATMGKAVGKDADKGKATLVSLYGPETVRSMLDGLKEDAQTMLVPFGDRGAILTATARFIVERTT